MKKILYLLCLSLIIVGLTACSSSDSESKETVKPTSDSGTQTAAPVVTEDSKTNSNASNTNAIYGEGVSLVEIPVGATSKAFAFKVPSDSVVTGVKLSKDGNEETIDGLANYANISDAISDGLFNENNLYGFEVTLSGQDSILLYGVTYKVSDISYDDLIAGYSDKTELTSSPYQVYSFKEDHNGQGTVGISINAGDYIYTIAINIVGNEDYNSVAQELYSLINFN